MKSRTALIVSVVAVVFMCAVIFTLSAMPADDSTRLSTGVIWHIVGFIVPGYDQMSAADQLYWQARLQFPVRKAAHFSEYAILGMLMLNMVRQFARDRVAAGAASSGREDAAAGAATGAVSNAPARFQTTPKQVLIAWALSIAYCLTDEIHQIFVPGRTFKLLDICIDSAGALTGIAILLLALWLMNKVRRRSSQ